MRSGECPARNKAIAAPERMAAKGRLLRPPYRSDLDSLRDGEGIFQVNAEIPDGAVHLGVSKEELNSAQIACLAVDLRNLRSPH